jgi:hypothetical protein
MDATGSGKDTQALRGAANWIIVIGVMVGLWAPLLYRPSAVPVNMAPTQLGKAFEQQFPFRAAWRWQYNFARYWLLRALPIQVVKGEDGWLFYRGEAVDDGHVFDDFLGEVSPNEELVATWCETMAKRRAWLASRAIALASLVVPNKETVYPDKLPDQLGRKRGRSRLDSLMEKCGSELIDIRPALAAGRGPRDLYYPLGTHWTSFGAHIGYRATLRALPIDPIPRAAFQEKLRFDPDSWLLEFGGVIPDLSWELDPIESYPACREIEGRCQRILEPDGPKMLQHEPRGITVTNPDEKLPTAVIFHDSFQMWLAPLLAQHFRTAVFVPGAFQAAFVERYKPDVVIIETVERYLARVVEPEP